MDRRKLPIGIQTFRQIREEGYYYVDKTAWARRLADDAGKHYFLSRPRRFGKSLFVDTLKELYEGNEALFRGLSVHDGWDWSKRHPVVRLDFSSGDFFDPDELHDNLTEQFDALESEYAAESGYDRAPIRLRSLLRELHRRTGRRVVVLVDEYDKPILDAIEDPEIAKLNRRRLRALYGTIKFADAHVELTFITGVSKYSKVSLFSDLNNLIDLTLDPAYAAICGYTESDLDAVFAPELPGLDRDAIRAWYNGYHWLGEERLYNPFGLLMLFRSRVFKAHWFETATPRFLIDTLIQRGFAAPDLEGVHASETLLSSFDVEAIAPEALLFQTGYLTIADERQDDGFPQYRLSYPNREVRRALNATSRLELSSGRGETADDEDCAQDDGKHGVGDDVDQQPALLAPLLLHDLQLPRPVARKGPDAEGHDSVHDHESAEDQVEVHLRTRSMARPRAPLPAASIAAPAQSSGRSIQNGEVHRHSPSCWRART